MSDSCKCGHGVAWHIGVNSNQVTEFIPCQLYCGYRSDGSYISGICGCEKFVDKYPSYNSCSTCGHLYEYHQKGAEHYSQCPCREFVWPGKDLEKESERSVRSPNPSTKRIVEL
jgi:hypothetical protein